MKHVLSKSTPSVHRNRALHNEVIDFHVNRKRALHSEVIDSHVASRTDSAGIVPPLIRR